MAKTEPSLAPSEALVEHPILIAAAGEVPILGAVVSGWAGMIARRRQQDTENFLHELLKRIEALEKELKERIDAKRVLNGRYDALLASAIEHQASEPDERKRKYLLDFLVGAAVSTIADLEVVDIYWRLIRDLQGVHLLVLQDLFEGQGSLSDEDLAVVEASGGLQGHRDSPGLASSLGLETRLVQLVVADLRSRGLCRVVEAKPDSVTLSPLGRDFFEFVRTGSPALG